MAAQTAEHRAAHAPTRLSFAAGVAKSPRARTGRPEASAVSCPRVHTASSASVSVRMTETSSACSPFFGGRNCRKSIRPVEACKCTLIEDESRQAFGVADRTVLVRIGFRRSRVRLANRVVLTGRAAPERNEASQEVHQCTRPSRKKAPARTALKGRSGQSCQL